MGLLSSSPMRGETTLIDSGNIVQSGWTLDNLGRYYKMQSSVNVAGICANYQGVGKLFVKAIITPSNNYKYSYIMPVYYDSSVTGVAYAKCPLDNESLIHIEYVVVNNAVVYYIEGNTKDSYIDGTWNFQLIGID